MSEITMPRLSDTMADGTIATWRKKVGDRINSGDVLAEIETDKAIMELEAYDEGILQRILVDEGTQVPIGTPIALIGDDAAQAVPRPEAASAPDTAGVRPVDATPTRSISADTARVAPADPRPKASPLARRLARERGIDLDTLHGSGPNGRITRVDIEAAASRLARQSGADGASRAQPAEPVAATDPERAGAPVPDHEGGEASDEVTDVPLTRVQRVAAARLTQSKQQAPHFYLTSAVDVTDLLAFRETLNASLTTAGEVKVSVNDLIVKAVASALRANPSVNVSFADTVLRQYRRVHVGVAVATPSGLLVPVVRDADRKSISEIAKQNQRQVARARHGKLRPEDMSGATFTVSNLGMFGIEQFAAVINPPEAAILAVGAAAEEVRQVGGELTVRRILRLTLSCDHRAVDGATGAAFLRDLAALLQEPLRVIA